MSKRTILTTLFGLLGLAALYAVSRYNFLLFHSLAETISIAVAWAVFVVAWNSRRVVENNYVLLIGIGFLFSGLLDFLHTLAYPGMGVFPWHGPNLGTCLWLAARLVQTGALILAPLFVRRDFNAYAAFSGFALVTGVLLGAIFAGAFPLCYTEGSGLTPFKLYTEYVICLGMAAASFKLWREKKFFSRPVFSMLMGYILFSVLQELTFTLFTELQSSYALVGHLLKIVAVYCLYKAMVVTSITTPQELLYWRLKKSEEELRASRERFKTVADFTYDWEFWLDENGECVWVSPSAKRITGYAAEEFYEDPELFQRIVHPSDKDAFTACNSSHQGQEPPRNTEFRIIRKDGHIRWIGHVCQPVYDFEGNWRGRRGSNRDVTEIKKAEALKQDVERIARHDLKSPISGLVGAAAALKGMDNLTDQQRLLLEKMEQASQQALNMVDLSLTLLKIEENKYEIHPEPLNVASMVEKASLDISNILNAKKIRTVLDCAREDGASILGEELLTRSMLGNLLKNAAEACPENGTVAIRVNGSNGACSIAIENQGEVPLAVRGKFFEKYATHGKRTGMGLGTYSARLLAEVQKGTVALDTSVAGKTTVTISMPSAR
ncbi:sensor histidine kinase [Salidesulfovibrio onnuriiensis]|uniref:sensor histidine kinase n=1 Tax=Salidesulfovibrio onnuriiensis TaxID=2583823 RepID=UPI0011C8C7CC|nr:MASE3 domain-containing protein [Salidesulfovibrio onnuriiensis]